jgi:hypothetical protein
MDRDPRECGRAQRASVGMGRRPNTVVAQAPATIDRAVAAFRRSRAGAHALPVARGGRAPKRPRSRRQPAGNTRSARRKARAANQAQGGDGPAGEKAGAGQGRYWEHSTATDAAADSAGKNRSWLGGRKALGTTTAASSTRAGATSLQDARGVGGQRGHVHRAGVPGFDCQ